MISLLVPTRGRPEGLARMWTSALATADDPLGIEIVVRVDADDDPPLSTALGVDDTGPKVTVLSGPRTVLSRCWNECSLLAEGEILMHASDDIVFRTPGWDTAVREAFEAVPDRIAFVHGRDGFQDDRLGTHGFVHRRWVDAVGYFVPPYFVSDYNDLWLHEVATALGRRVFLPDVLTEHMHPVANKGPLDRTHRDRLARQKRERPDLLYAALSQRRARDVDALLSVMEPAPAHVGAPRWTVLVCSVEQRRPYLARMLAQLIRLAEPHGGAVDVVVYVDDFDRTRHEARNLLVAAAAGDYVSFVDDDDELPLYFVDRVLRALGNDPDYVGWRMQCVMNGRPLKPTFHSTRYRGWSDDARGYYRDISHLNPIRREIAAAVPFPPVRAEDHAWAMAVAESGLVRSESYVDEVMYLYDYDTGRSLVDPANRTGERPDVDLPKHPLVRWL